MISRGLESASKGMQSLIEYQDVIANNLANVNTTGFKRTNVAFKNLLDARVEQPPNLAKAQDKYRTLGSLSTGASLDRTYLDFSQGPLNPTGEKLDIGVKGEGFFKVLLGNSPDTPEAVNDPKNVYYSRGGNLHLTQDFYLVNVNGDYILDNQDRRIRIVRDPDNPNLGPDNYLDYTKDLLVGENGQLQITNPEYQRMLQTIAIYDFNNKSQISTVGDGKYLPIRGTNPEPYLKREGFSLHQGTLEGANSNTVVEMIHSINVSRTYETLTKLVKTQGDTISSAIELGRIRG